ncbi:cation diffusion facilitator family transporter [Leptolyngbya sp. BC1307]|uniref:cation diffusion facilitator family transporter n=1 Tax=Leptolyngbya sp. BC1307 TaxID=2029589 RepID=UPI000EFABF4E|nr:cation diffusion facilitator family transporter [Leptolyngbya sp. BC1307]
MHTQHSSAHSCAQGHAHCHSVPPSTPGQVRALSVALITVSCFSVAELWVSAHSHSLALLADAGHMISDVLAIALALWTANQVQQAKSDRLNAVSALVNGSLLLLVSGWLGWEAIAALRSPPTGILSGPVAITAAIGLGVNGLNAYLLHAHAQDNLNLRGAFLHMLADAGSCLGVLIAALLIAQFGWYWTDGGVGLAIALLIAASALPLIRQSWATLKAMPQPKPLSD